MNKGYIALISILIISALMLTISIGLSLRSIGETKMALAEQLSSRALALADACAEHALEKLKEDLNYSGNETIIIDGSDTCDVLATEGSDNNNRIVKTQATISDYVRKIKADIAVVNPEMQFNYWNEVADF